MLKNQTALYVGVGGGIEALQLAYFCRRPSGVIAIDPVPEMRQAARANLELAAQTNNWFDPDFVTILDGDALELPVEDDSVGFAAQNCLFNIFKAEDLKKAVAEMYRVLKPNGRLVLSDPISEDPMPESLKNDERLRALCLSGALPLQDYIKMITDIGFGTIEVRAKRPYRILDTAHFDTDKDIFIESVEICAIKDPTPEDGPCVFTGRTAIYFGDEEFYDDHKGHTLLNNQPLAVCDKTAESLLGMGRKDIFVSESTYFYDGGGCC